MEEIWNELKSHFSKVEGALDDLRDPISVENEKALRDKIECSALADLLESLRCHDGQFGDLFLFGPWRLESSQEILAGLKSGFFSSLFGNRKPVNRIMFADNGGNAWLEVEIATGAIREVWEDGDTIVFPSYRAFMERVLTDLNSGVLEFDQQCSGYAVSGDLDAYWPVIEREPGV